MPSYAKYPSLENRVIFVTGGATGIGADIVRAFHANGSVVAFIDILEKEGRALSAALGGAATFIKCDIMNIEALRSSIDEVRRTLGPIGALVNNAANDDRHDIDDVDIAYWDWSQAINLRPHFFAAQAVRPHMRELGGGSIVNLSSIAWRIGTGTMVPYATAKAAVIGLTKSLADGFGADNIRVNSVEPGAVMTEKQRRLWYQTQASVDAMVERQILKRMLLGDEIARAVLFLAADDSAMITKQSIIVDGGTA